MTSIALRAEGLGKEYALGRQNEKYATLRDAVMSGLAAPGRILRSWRRPRAPRPMISALRDVSFEVSHGEVIGVIGRNGAGKSTLLKILSRITSPTTGRVELHGRVGSLLEVGTGFHNELTGRENIFLNGAILGMRRTAIERQLDEIVAFAEIERFLDTAVKHYSTGMYLRLAFAVAAHMETDILLIDEVLAVGDLSFQRKCLGKMGEVAKTGRTVLFVSHNMNAVGDLCRRGLWLDGGRVCADGAVDDVMNAYLATMSEGKFQFESADYGLVIRGISLRNGLGDPCVRLAPGEDLVVEVDYEAKRPITSPYFLFVIQGVYGPCFTANMLLDGQRPARLDGTGRLSCRFRSLPLLPQNYVVRMRMVASDGRDTIFGLQEVASFSVDGNMEEDGFFGERFFFFAPRSTPVVVPYEWVLPDGSVKAVGIRHREASALREPARKA